MIHVHGRSAYPLLRHGVLDGWSKPLLAALGIWLPVVLIHLERVDDDSATALAPASDPYPSKAISDVDR
jgi:hypothetical protein